MLVSGATVMIAMAGMLFSGDKTFISMSIGTMMVVAVAMIGSLTVLPAVLSKLGDRVEKGRIPLLSRLRRPAGEGRIWREVLTPVLRRPALSAALAVALLATLAIPTLQIHTAHVGPEHAAPQRRQRSRRSNRVQAAFPGQALPAVIAVKTNTTTPAFKTAVAAAAGAGSRAATRATERSASTPTRAHTVARITIPLPGNGTDASLDAGAAETLRGQLLPATIGTLPNVTYAVTGNTAGSLRLERDDEELAAARLRLRARRSRSSCCWRRSARW